MMLFFNFLLRALALVKSKKTGVPSAFSKNTFGKKKVNLKRIAKVSRGALAAVEVHNKYVDAEEERMKARSKKKLDRLQKDKKYLNSLQRQLTMRTDIPDDKVHMQVLLEAEDVLNFLKQRDLFWDQLQSK